MVDETRCPCCGRPSKGGTLLPREIPCQGCHAEYDAAIAAGKTAAQALEVARAAHETREKAAYDALVRQRYLNNIAGKHADDPTKALEDFSYKDAKGVDRVLTVAEMKARATVYLARYDAAEAARAEER